MAVKYRLTAVVVKDRSPTNFPEIDASYFNSPISALEKYLDKRPELDKGSMLEKARLLLEESI